MNTGPDDGEGRRDGVEVAFDRSEPVR